MPLLCFALQATAVKVVLPASAAARKGLVKHAVDGHSVVVDAGELQLCMPGNFLWVADQVRGARLGPETLPTGSTKTWVS
jgi:hypothetical protein